MNIALKIYHSLPLSLKSFIRDTYTFLIKTFHLGKYNVNITKNQSFWVAFNNLPEYREAKNFLTYEPEFLNEFIKQSLTANVIYDVGANIGLYSLVARMQNEQAQVFAFEPEEECCNLIKKSTKLNNLTNINVKEYCIGDQNGEISLSLQGSTGHFVSRNNLKEQTISKPVFTLDHLVKTKELPLPDLVKIDVEGYEMHVLRGMKNVLEEKKPALLIEVHFRFMDNYGESGDELIKYLEKMDYKTIKLREPGIGQNTTHSQSHYLFISNSQN